MSRYANSVSPVSPRGVFGTYTSPSRFSSPSYAAEAGEYSNLKVPGSVISYVSGTSGGSRSTVGKRAPGAPPNIEELGEYGVWKGTRFGYILAYFHAGSRAALQRRGIPAPSLQEVQAAIKRYWRNLPDADYRALEAQLEALADEQGYVAPEEEETAVSYASYTSPRRSVVRSARTNGYSPSYRSPRSIGTGRRTGLSPVEIEDEGINGGFTNSYSRQYGLAEEY
ncbi:Hypothetical protein BQ3484_23 [Cedratvirus A11]|uniref:Uncharacterized protein n=1 Tax=Cedratvirus A11 TaxID=1903266 RepID=A0A1M7XTT3_9VIRU|nr:Hypothetical protein BQ3484_23 [Cedratvirus A11]SHO33091.1 Hypothetical protein BQ3484_23 [Cedratvirus A11]